MGKGLVGVKTCSNDTGYTRYGFIVSKRVGGAVTRNRVKRRLREIVRRTDTKQGMDIIISARPQAAGASFAVLKNDVTISLARAGVMQDDKNNRSVDD